MHSVMLILIGLLSLGVVVLIATLINKRAGDGARVFIWLWLVASVINSGIGFFRYNIPLLNEMGAFIVIFGVPAVVAWYLSNKFASATR